MDNELRLMVGDDEKIIYAGKPIKSVLSLKASSIRCSRLRLFGESSTLVLSGFR